MLYCYSIRGSRLNIFREFIYHKHKQCERTERTKHYEYLKRFKNSIDDFFSSFRFIRAPYKYSNTWVRNKSKQFMCTFYIGFSVLSSLYIIRYTAFSFGFVFSVLFLFVHFFYFLFASKNSEWIQKLYINFQSFSIISSLISYFVLLSSSLSFSF